MDNEPVMQSGDEADKVRMTCFDFFGLIYSSSIRQKLMDIIVIYRPMYVFMYKIINGNKQKWELITSSS